MKKNSLLLIATAILMTACGTVAQQAVTSSGSRFEDGIYSNGPSFRSKVEKQEAKAETQALVEKTKESAIYLFGDKKDTIMIPENMMASIRYDKGIGSTVVTVGENPYDWHNYINPWAYYTPYSIGGSWYCSRHYNPWYGDPWYWNSWAYTPWYYRGWHDPLYYGGWYDPWYYGYGGYYGGWYGGYYGGYYGGWYSPYYGYMYPHYAGWYGGWDPYWGHHHHHMHGGPIDNNSWHGPRKSTGADRAFTSGVSTRGGIATASRTGRAATTASVSRGQAEKLTSASRASGKASVSRVSAVTPSRTSVASKPETGNSRNTAASSTVNKITNTATSVQNYRRPSSVSTSGTTDRTVSGTAAQRPSGTQSYRDSGSSSYRSSGNSSATSRQSYTPSPTRSYSTGSGFSGGASRSGGGSYSGGASRSGGSSSVRR